MRFDDVIVQLGEFGLFQKRIYILLCYPMLVCAFQKLVWVFIAATPLHRCRIELDDFNNGSNPYYLSQAVLNKSIPWNYDKNAWDSCSVYTNPRLDDHSDPISDDITQCNSWVYDNSQYISSVISDFDLVCSNKWLAAMIISLQMGGELCGSILLGMLSDRFGRKLILIISGVGLGATGVATSFASHPVVVAVFRMAIGFWTPGLISSAFVIAMEFVGPKKRVFAGIVIQYFFGVGFLFIAVAAYFIRSWKTLEIALSIPSLVILFYYWLIPESVRWLLSKNKNKEAIRIIRKAAVVNKRNISEDFYLSEIDTEKVPTGSLKDVFRYPNLRKRTLVVLYCWFVNTCVYYGFSLNTSSLAGNDYVNFGLSALVEFPAYTFCFLVLDKFGRRLPLCATMIVGGIALLASPFLPSDQLVLGITLAMIGKCAITASYATIYMFTAELFPTAVRAACYGMSSSCGRIGAMLAPFILLLRNYWNPIPSILFSIFAISSGLLCLMLPETTGRELPDTIEEGENFAKRMPKSNNLSLNYTKKLSQNGTATECTNGQLSPMLPHNNLNKVEC